MACSDKTSFLRMMPSSFRQPEFIAALYQKLCALRAGIKNAGVDSIYSALHFYRYWSAERRHHVEIMEGVQGELHTKLQAILQDYDARLAESDRLLSEECRRIFRTDDLTAFQRLGKAFVHSARYQSSAYKRLDWAECYCAVTLQFLHKGKVPTKKEVRESAFREMAIRLLPVGAGEQAISTKIKTLRGYGPKRPDRIFDALGLVGLPEAPSRPGEAYRH
jgi:hypothetical protein